LQTPTTTSLDSVSLVRFNPEHAIYIAALGRHMHCESNYSNIPYDGSCFLDFIFYVIDHPDDVFGLTVLDGESVVGFFMGELGSYFYSEEKLAENLAIYLDPKHRSYILARRMVNEFEGWAREHGAKRVYLDVSFGPSDEKVGKFFKYLGYSDKGNVLTREI